MPSARGRWHRYGFAFVVVACALLLTPLLRRHIETLPGALWGAAVVGTAWYGGVGPGLLAWLMILVFSPIVLPPRPDAPPPDAAALLGMFVFLLATILLGWQSSASGRARAALRLLADAGKSLAASLDYESCVAATARLAVPEFADGCVVDLLGADGAPRAAAAAHTDPVLEEKLRLAAQCQSPAPEAAHGVAEVLRTGRPVAGARLSAARLGALVPEEPRRQALRALGVRSLLIVPLRARGRTLGTLMLLSARRFRRFRRADLLLAGELADRAALAIDNARFYREARDMEEALRRRAEQLAVADRHKDEFLAVVAHELRGPLAALRGALEVLRLYGPGAPLRDAPQGIMARQVEALARLVDDLLDVARITRGKIALHRQTTDLNDVLRAAVGTAGPLLDARRHTLTVTLPREGPTLDADPLRLEQVFVNLLTNAAKYTEPGGHVWLSAALDEGAGEPPRAVVSVRDSGIGMTPDFLARAFHLFVQGPEAPAGAQGGLGIGLSLVRRLVELHGGTVEGHSDGPGQGSEFVVRLPLRQEEGGRLNDDEGTAPAEVPASALRLPPSRRVLLVDDNLDAAEVLAALLRLRGHEVRVAPDGTTALALVRDYVPEVVLLDLGLPGMDGHEVGRRLRRQPGLDAALIVALTGAGTEDDRRRSREAGFDHHLVKPVDPEDLDQLLGAGR
jgi:signal transduction histidine kinase/CheY-like chemotaxis protein